MSLDFDDMLAFKVEKQNIKVACACCLTEQGAFTYLSKCFHAGFLQDIIKNKENYPFYLICSTCHYFATKVCNFLRQVEANIKILEDELVSTDTIVKANSLCVKKQSNINLSGGMSPLIVDIRGSAKASPTIPSTENNKNYTVVSTNRVKYQIVHGTRPATKVNEPNCKYVVSNTPPTYQQQVKNETANRIQAFTLSSCTSTNQIRATSSQAHMIQSHCELPMNNSVFTNLSQIKQNLVRLPTMTNNTSDCIQNVGWLTTTMPKNELNCKQNVLWVIKPTSNLADCKPNVGWMTNTTNNLCVVPPTNQIEALNEVTIKEDPLDFETEDSTNRNESAADVDVPGIKETAGEVEVSGIKKSESDTESIVEELEKETEKAPADSAQRRVVRNSTSSRVVRKSTSVKKIVDAPQLSREYMPGILEIYLTHELMLAEREKARENEPYKSSHYKCEDCIVYYEYEGALEWHMRRIHKTNQKLPTKHVCPICKAVSERASGLNSHLQRHFRRYKCADCGLMAIDPRITERHRVQDHKVFSETYKCKQCDFVTHTYLDYKCHFLKHKKSDPLPCDLCDKEFPTRSQLNSHKRMKHSGLKKTFKCPECPGSYLKRSIMDAHIRACHRAVPVYCAPCNKYFKSERCLKTHLLKNSNHIGEEAKKYVCDYCDRRYVEKSALAQHIKVIHLKSDEYKCAVCSKRFLNRLLLKKHVEYVHEKKQRSRNHVCHWCGKQFTDRRILESHLNTHTGARPYKCQYCAADFGHTAARYNHVRLVHKREKDRGGEVQS